MNNNNNEVIAGEKHALPPSCLGVREGQIDGLIDRQERYIDTN